MHHLSKRLSSADVSTFSSFLFGPGPVQQVGSAPAVHIPLQDLGLGLGLCQRLLSCLKMVILQIVYVIED